MMKMKNYGLRIELVDSEEAFLAIEVEWNALFDKSINSSIYSSYPFVHTAWKYFRNENDRLFLLIVKRDATIVAIAPFRIEKVKMGNIRFKWLIRFIAEYGGGDKPSILTTEEPDCIWDGIFQFLSKEYTQWDGIQLFEQPANSPFLNQQFFSNRSYSARAVPQVNSSYVSIAGTWEEYLKTRGKETRRKWKKSRKKLFDLPEGVRFQCIEDYETVPEALERYLAIEQSGWKNNRDFSVGGSEKNKRYYEDLLRYLAQSNMLSMYFLTSGNTDIAAAILYKQKSIVYGAHITYRPTFAEYSPGVVLTTEILKMLFGSQYHEFDFLGFRNEEKNTLKKNWSTGTRQTIRIEVYKKSGFILLYMIGRRVNKIVQNAMRMMISPTPSKQTQTGSASSPTLTEKQE
jgi:hypothetical protein